MTTQTQTDGKELPITPNPPTVIVKFDVAARISHSVPPLQRGETAVLVRAATKEEYEASKIDWFIVLYTLGSPAQHLRFELDHAAACAFVRLPGGVATPLSEIGAVLDPMHVHPPGSVVGS
jgi:hypothetical protein